MKIQTSKTRTLLAGVALVALTAASLARADYPGTVTSQGPVGYWRLSETTASPPPITTAVNSGSSAAGNGTYQGSQGYLRGFAGALASSDTSIHTDGAGQSVLLPYNADLNPAANFTVEVWLKADGSGAQCPISCGELGSIRSGWLIYQFGSTGYEFRMYNTNGTAVAVDVVGTVANVVGVWTHVVATYDGTTAKLYLNGSLANSVNATGTPHYVPGTDGPFSVGMRADTGFPWAGGADEVAFYPSVLTAGEIATHYGAATTNAAGYAAMVAAKSPLVYMRLDEQGNTSTANLGTLGSAGNGEFTSGSTPGVDGPRPPTYPGFESLNYAVGFSGTAGSVALPPLNLNANTVTISCWVKAVGNQPIATGLVVTGSGGTASGLTIDQSFAGLGLGAIWGGQNYGWSPSGDSGLPSLPDSDWAYAALIIRPSQAELYICDANNFADFTSVTNTLFVNGVQPFDSATLVGTVAGTTRYFNGSIDEVSIFNRALGAGELYSQYATAVGGVPPKIFGDLQGPTAPVAAGDPIVLSVDAGGTSPVVYTWRKNGSTVATTTDNGTLTIASSTLTDNGAYDVHIVNGSGTADSQVVPVTVVTPTAPAITGTVGFNNRTIYKGATLKLAVTATGGGLKYQWYKNGSPIASATASAYIVPSVTNSDAGSFSVNITNSVNRASNGPVAISIPVMASNSYEAAIITAAPEAWWRLDETSGTNMFDGMGRHDGTYTNANGSGPLPTLGATGALVSDTNTAASFSSTGKGIGLVPYSADLNASKYSIEAWVKTSVTDGQAPVSSSFGSGGSWIQSVTGWWWGDSSAGTFGNNLFINTNASIIAGFWSHVVITYDAAQSSSGTFYPYRLYVNGSTDGYIWGGPSVNGGGPFIIGARGVSATTLADRFFDGQVDEVAVYKRVLTQAEIQSHFTTRGTVIIPPSFTSALLSQTVTTGKKVSFSTSVLGTAPISLQWYKNSSPISQATNASYTITNTVVGDTGTYTLWATNSAGTNSTSASLTVMNPVAYANVTNNLVLHLRFDGNATDSSGRGNNGTASTTTAPAYVPGIIGGQALQYTTTTTGGNVSSASYVSLGTAGSGPPADLRFGASQSFSISLWVKLVAASMPGDLPFIGTETNSANNPGWDLCPSYQLGGWQWDLNDGVNNLDVNGADNSINDGAWHNFVLSVDRTSAMADSYLDGVRMANRSVASLGSIDNNNYWPIVIGQDPTFLYPEAATATVDDIGVWKRALTATEVAQLQSAGSTGGRSFDTVAPASVTITITRSGSQITLSWSSGTLLQSSTLDASASWTPVSGASAPSYTFTPGTGNVFYKVLVQ